MGWEGGIEGCHCSDEIFLHVAMFVVVVGFT